MQHHHMEEIRLRTSLQYLSNTKTFLHHLNTVLFQKAFSYLFYVSFIFFRSSRFYFVKRWSFLCKRTTVSAVNACFSVSSSQKHSGMARVVDGSHRFTVQTVTPHWTNGHEQLVLSCCNERVAARNQ